MLGKLPSSDRWHKYLPTKVDVTLDKFDKAVGDYLQGNLPTKVDVTQDNFGMAVGDYLQKQNTDKAKKNLPTKVDATLDKFDEAVGDYLQKENTDKGKTNLPTKFDVTLDKLDKAVVKAMGPQALLWDCGRKLLAYTNHEEQHTKQRKVQQSDEQDTEARLRSEGFCCRWHQDV